jgi:hypothetical protein
MSRWTIPSPVIVAIVLVIALTVEACETAGAPSPVATPAPTATTSQPTFACPPPMIALVPPGNRLTGISVTGETGFDRVAFEFGPSGAGSGARPGLIVNSVTPPFVEGASGLPLAVAGDRFVELTFRDMIVADERGNPSLAGPTRLTADGPAVQEAVQAEAFEGVVRWIIGAMEPGCARVTLDTAGMRVLVDLQVP